MRVELIGSVHDEAEPEELRATCPDIRRKALGQLWQHLKIVHKHPVMLIRNTFEELLAGLGDNFGQYHQR